MLVLLLGCQTDPKHPIDPGTSVPTGSTTTPTTSVPTTTIPQVDAVTGLSWSLSPNMASIVIASWSQDVAGTTHVEYSFDDGVWESSPPFEAAVGPQTQALVGIPFDTVAAWRVVSGDQTVDGPELTTGRLPSGFPVPRLSTSDPTRYLPEGRFLLSSINAKEGTWIGGYYWTFILDREGRTVWARLAPTKHWTLFAQVSVTGDYLLWDESTAWSDFDDGAGSRIHETWLDEEFGVVATPGLHHAFVQLPDGTLAWGSLDHAASEALVEKAPGQSDETVIWTCQSDWPGVGAGCESNGLYYDLSTDSYLYSFYTNSSVVSVARSGDATGPTPGSSLWWAGGAADGFAFDPPQSQFYWQHGISYTSDRTLLVSSMNKGNTWLLEYEIDSANQTLHNVWSSNSGVLAEENGAAWRLDNGNTLHVVGTSGVVREVTADGEDVWRITWDSEHNLGEGQLLDDLYPLIKPRG